MFSFLFSRHGRFNRARYWLAIAAVLIVWTAGIFTAVIVRSATGTDNGMTIAVTIGLTVLIAGAAIGIFAGIRRLHDRAKSAWWLLPLYGVPGVFYCFRHEIILQEAYSPPVFALVYSTLPVLLLGFTLWAVVELGCWKGTSGPNAYGPDPRLQRLT